jgi:predicted CoA-substrate-specific enzyme activase
MVLDGASGANDRRIRSNNWGHGDSMSDATTSIGICIGASTVSVVRLAVTPRAADQNQSLPAAARVVETITTPHEGNPRKTVLASLAKIDIPVTAKMAATGRKFRRILNMPSIAEPQAVELAYAWSKPEGVDCPGIIAAGGETFMVYKLNPSGQITNVFTGNKCAAGTGEFFLQQLGRLGATLEDAARWAETTPAYKVSGRCSVFCKSDCTHATNKGIAKERVASGLGRMMADKILELLRQVDHRNLMLTGGTIRNRMMVAHLKKALPGLIIPESAACFEAFGAALWAADQPRHRLPQRTQLFLSQPSRFEKLPKLAGHAPRVCFKSLTRRTIQPADRCLLGLDVGSTTTKAVLVRKNDNALLASVYLRTNGDPVKAARLCYRAIEKQILPHVDPHLITIAGLGVCGSGRQIAGLHAMTSGVFNEITAHATAAVYFDPEVDTIFEIGGQDAKYTHLTNGVPSDYAMNEACSAGTGSFLEESAWETMGIPVEQIAEVAMRGQYPPNFNDQCAAFIASDIKNAIQEGLSQEDIAAGLVYSICLNYTNRVRGNRPVGRKVFMQGGVCYNRAVPLAMAGVVDQDIIVPPEPGLMGAFGAALEVGNRLDNGLLAPDRFRLSELARREVSRGPAFNCKGGKSRCDRRCEIAQLIIDGRSYPFGGACNRYENLRSGRRVAADRFNLIRHRQDLVFDTCPRERTSRPAPQPRGKVGLNRSFLVNTYFPLYANFFHALGFEIVLPDLPDDRGIGMRNAPFCFPAELAHGFFYDLISGDTALDYLFMPHFKSIPPINGERITQLCPLVQGESFYLKATFRERLADLGRQGTRLLSPRLDLSGGIAAAKPALVAMAAQMGVPRRTAALAFDKAHFKMNACLEAIATAGQTAIRELEATPERFGIVLFARPYNGYAPEAHMGIPDKFASRGILVLPLEALRYENQPSTPSMYWGMGQRILMAARIVESHPQLFGTYLTNFSCGPDSFILGYFRQLMGSKPALTLELDSHSADAGLETRIDAFLDIVGAWRRCRRRVSAVVRQVGSPPARTTLINGVLAVHTSDGSTVPFTDPRVHLLFPSMGKLGAEALAAAFRSVGFNASALPPCDETTLKTGRTLTSCKECLPLILTTGALLTYIRTHQSSGEIVVYFMPDGSGPCRFGQYHIFMANLLEKLQVRDVAIFSLSSDRGYDGVPGQVHRRGWQAVVVSDCLEDIRSMLLANARHPRAAMERFHDVFTTILGSIEAGNFRVLAAALRDAARELGRIPLKQPADEVPVITLAGEIFVRRDGLSRRRLTEYLAERGFATACAPVSEWILYTDKVAREGWSDYRHNGVKARLRAWVKHQIMIRDERRILTALSGSGLVHAEPVSLDRIIEAARPHISPHLCGEAILTVGSALEEVGSKTCGVIAIGPFGCMPNRLSEAILTEVMKLPFLAIESDGLPFPQQTEAKLEAFCLRAARLHRHMRGVN